jgi:hypothetical protein
MSILSFGLPKPQTDLGGAVVLDVLQTEDFELPGEVTLYPTEDGAEVSDHIFCGAERLRIAGTVSASALFNFSLGGVSTRMADAIEALEGLRNKRQTFEVSTGLRLYPDMAFATLRFSRKGEGQGNWLFVDAELIRVRTVTLREADVPERAAAPSARGRAGRTATPAGRTSDSGAGAATGAQFGPGETGFSRLMQRGEIPFTDRTLSNPLAGR